MNTKGRKVKLPLTTLIEILEGEGFRIDIDQRLKLQKILLLFREEIPVGDFDNLKYYIRPLIAKSHNQQLVFDQAFEKYVRYIKSKSEVKKHTYEVPKKWNIIKYKSALLFSLGTIAFLLFAYYMNSARELPNINMSVPAQWASVGDSLTIEGQISGIFVDASISVNDSVMESQHFTSPENDIISYTNKFYVPGTHRVKLSANNTLVKKDTSQIISIEVCESKPQINFQYEFDSLNPLKVTFKPKITNVSNDFSLSMRSNGKIIPPEQLIIPNDSMLIYEFNNPDTYDIQLTVNNNTNPIDSICDLSTSRKVISLNSVILGDKMGLVKADPLKRPFDSLNRIEKDSAKLRVGVISYKKEPDLRETYGAIFDSVISKLDQYEGLELNFDKEEQLSEALLQGDLDIGVYTVFPYLKAAHNNPELTVTATHQIAGKNNFKGHIITRKSDGYDELADLVGRRFTFVKATSTSGYEVPKGIFQIRGHTIENTAFQYNFSGGHKESIAFLLNGKTDGIAVDESRFQQAKDSLNIAALQIIHDYEVPYNAYVLSPALTNHQRDLIKSALIDSIRVKADNPLGIERVVSVNDGYYNELRRYLNITRRKPGFVLDSIEIAKEINTGDPNFRKIIADSILLRIVRSNRFADKDSTQYNYKANLTLDGSKDAIFRYNIFLNNQFIGTGEVDTTNVIHKLPELFVDWILNALPIQTKLLKGNAQKNLFIPYGKNDGINAQDYVFRVSGDTIDSNDITLTDFDTYFENLDHRGFKNSDMVRVTHPSPNTNTTQYFNIFKTTSWERISGEDMIVLFLWLAVFLILPPVGLEFLYFRKRRVIPSKEITSSLQFEGIKPPYELELPNQNHSIRPEKELYVLSRRLKHRREAGTSKLDVFKSIRKTARNAGFVKLFFRETTKVPEYLVIVDRGSAEGFHKELFAYLNQFLQNEDTLLDVFYFSNSPKYLKNHKYPEGISLETLSEKYPDHTLLLISDGSKLINSKLDRIFRWASEVIPKWNTRFLLTPKSFREWDLSEDLIDQYLPVFPATLKGMLFMTECLSEKQLPDFKKRKNVLELKEGNSFYSYDSIEGIKEFLKDPALFQWFCALALYPKLHWPFVIIIGKAIAEKYVAKDADISVNYRSLYKISEVSHLLESDMDDDLRVELMQSLDPKVERIARQAILDLLHELKIPEDSYIFREVIVQSKVNHSLLNRNDLQATKDLFYLWENNLIEDWATRSYLAGSTKNIWNKKAEEYFSTVDHKSWKQLLFPRMPLYMVAAILTLIVLNLTLFQNIIKPQNPEFAIKVQHIDSTARKMVSYAAILNNQAVDIYNSDSVDLKAVVTKLQEALIKDDSLYEARHNINIILFNKAMDTYLSRNFKSTKRSLEALVNIPEIEDSLRLESLHYLGLSDYYQENIRQAQEYLNRLKDSDSLFLNRYYPNLETLLRNEIPSFCEKYSNYSASEWRRSFLKKTRSGTWHVFVASLGAGVTREEAEKRANNFRRANPNHDFNVMFAGISGKIEFQYTIVLAEGLESKARAQEIASFAIGCGIANDAFAQQQQPDISEKRQEEDKAWDVAKSTNTIESYQGYQKNYPKGNYYKLAQQNIDALKRIEQTTKCNAPWEWDADLQSCTRKITISPKTFSIPLKDSISSVAGRIDFYANRERLPGTDSEGLAMYKENNGALQVVIPIMLGKTLVGDLYEVIYSTKEGAICKVSSLPETTGWLKKMRVAYSLLLEADCNKAGSFCQAEIVQSGRRVHITTKELTVTICR